MAAVGIPERLGGKPRENADDAFATFMDMGEREWLGLIASMVGGGMLQPAEMEGFTRACDARAERNKAGAPACRFCGHAEDDPLHRVGQGVHATDTHPYEPARG